MELNVDIKVSKTQWQFIKAEQNEVLFGGAAGGGKSYAQIIDALIFAVKYPKSKQLILRRTYPELEKSIIRASLELYPRNIAVYKSNARLWKFVNKSVIEFGNCEREKDVYKYQSAEYDIIRFDELTHFTKDIYIYLMSRVRGTNGYPKQIKSSTNPSGIGHFWVKERFIDIAPPLSVYCGDYGSRIFIPSLVDDNIFLVKNDPEYKKRLNNLFEKDKKALLYGDWNIDDGVYFNEFKNSVHVVKPFRLCDENRLYMSLDYGLDMLACYWYSVDREGYVFVYRELYKSNLIIDDAAKAIKDAMTLNELNKMTSIFAPKDLWNRRQETGKSVFQRFADCGIYLTKVSNRREAGWYEVKRYLKPRPDVFGNLRPKLQIFNTCVNLIRTLPAVRHDERNFNDISVFPHEFTHAPDALRYFCDGLPLPADAKSKNNRFDFSFEDELEAFNEFNGF